MRDATNGCLFLLDISLITLQGCIIDEVAMNSRVVFKVVALSIILLTASAEAQADWWSKVSGPDVFGRTKVLSEVFNDSDEGIVIQCDSKKRFMLGYVFSGTPSEINRMSELDSVPAILYFRIDNNPILKIKAEFSVWNKDLVAFEFGDQLNKATDLVRQISNAKEKISVGAKSGSYIQSSMFTIIGSTTAMGKVMNNCALNIGPSSDLYKGLTRSMATAPPDYLKEFETLGNGRVDVKQGPQTAVSAPH